MKKIKIVLEEKENREMWVGKEIGGDREKREK